MKNFFTLFAIAFLASTMAVSAQQTPKTANQNKTVLVYSEEYEALVYKSSPNNSDSEIMIESLPGYGNEPIPVEINQNKKGSYTFTKHPSLMLPEYYSVVIMDSLTGKTFDLKTTDSYTFDVSKDIPERFVLQMAKTKTNLTAMR
ncbi:hypothetical protein [Aurantibacillus circumpalustris]|uniref:hypothetical protein n=1 Tax=Aurantibacillus circumpalustris TaxID=3036359 RepID=UPI00295B4F39|nr:hypothetical protein [Aurantibacillus circumpalustris]